MSSRDVWAKSNTTFTLFGERFPMSSTTQKQKNPRVLLFDIGGVCVVSPMQAILDYETSKNIPPGWVNFSISKSNPTGAWSRVERGEILADSSFFRAFKQDLSNPSLWKQHYRRSQGSDPSGPVPPVPDIDAEWLYWRMMGVARTPDPHMYPALQALRTIADRLGPGELVLAALSNTSIFPPEHAWSDAQSPQGNPVKTLFDVFISSAHVGMRKPETRFYEYAVTRIREWVKWRTHGVCGVEAGDFVFLDDIGTNLRTGREMGFRTIKVQLGKADVAVRELEEITGWKLSGGTGKARL